jgi:hypothetical protein
VTEDGRRALRRLTWALTLLAFAPALAVAVIASMLGGCAVEDAACRPTADLLTTALAVATPSGGWAPLAGTAVLFLGALAANHGGRPTLLARILGGWLIAFVFGGLLPLMPVFATESLLPRVCGATIYGTCPAFGTDMGPAARLADMSGWSLLIVGPVVGGVFLLYVAGLCVAAFVGAVRAK